MRQQREIRDLMISAIYGEADSEAQRKLEAALADNPELFREFEELKETKNLLSNVALADNRDKEFWEGVWPEFQRRLNAETTDESKEVTGFHWFDWNWRPLLQIGLVALMLVVGIFIGRFISSSQPAVEPATSTEHRFVEEPFTTVALPFEREIEQRKQDYIVDATRNSLRKSENLIEGFMNLESPDSRSVRELLVRDSNYSSKLLEDIAAIRSGLDEYHSAALNSILEEIELVISEIASIEGSEEDVWFEVKALQKGIDEGNILIRIRETDILRNNRFDDTNVKIDRVKQ